MSNTLNLENDIFKQSVTFVFILFQFCACHSLVVFVAEFTGRMTGSGEKSTPLVRRIPITPRPTTPDSSKVKLGHGKVG